jgi:hypothetical protein
MPKALDDLTKNCNRTAFSLVPAVSMLCVRKQADNMRSLRRSQYDSDALQLSPYALRRAVFIRSSTSQFRLEAAARNGRKKMALELLSHCGMIWRSLKATLFESEKSGFGFTNSDNRSAAERGCPNPDGNDAVLVNARAVASSKASFLTCFSISVF